MYLAVGTASHTMSIRAASVPRKHAAMNAGWSFSGVVVVVVDKGQDGDVGGMYVDCLV